MNKNPNIEILIDMILEKLMDRNGFSDWFFELDEDIVEEIYQDLNETILRWLDEETYEMDDE